MAWAKFVFFYILIQQLSATAGPPVLLSLPTFNFIYFYFTISERNQFNFMKNIDCKICAQTRILLIIGNFYSFRKKRALFL